MSWIFLGTDFYLIHLAQGKVIVYVRNLLGFAGAFEIIFRFRNNFLKADLCLEFATVSLVWIFALMFQNVVQSTKDVYGVNLSDVPSEDDITIYARWDTIPVVTIKRWFEVMKEILSKVLLLLIHI